MLIQLSNDYGLIEVKGPDAVKLLQGQLTCNVETLTADHLSLAAHCTPQGRIVSLFRIFIFKEAYYLLLPNSMITATLMALKKYSIFYNVELNDVSQTIAVAGIILPTNNLQLSNDAAIKSYSTQSLRHVMIGETGIINDTLEKYIKDVTLNAHHWKLLDIKEGLPQIYPETSGKFLPHEINLDQLNAIDFNKGCYTGQEIIARMHYRGKLKKHLYQTTVSTTDLSLGADIYYGKDKQVAGVIIDYCKETENRYRVLIVTDESKAKNEHLFINTSNPVFFTIL